MLIAIDLTSLSYHLTGIERFAMCVTDKMIDQDCTNKYFLIFRNSINPIFQERIDGDRIKAMILRGENKLFFLQWTLRLALERCKADKYLFFAFPGPFLFWKKGIINTIHDMGAWDSPDDMKLASMLYFKLSYYFASRVSEKIITVSKFSKKRIADILGVPLNRIEVINPAVFEGISSKTMVPFEKTSKEYRIPNNYIMTLSTLEPRKNITLLLETFDRISETVDYDLVLVGRRGWKIDEIVTRFKSKDRIHFTGFVKDEYLSSIYKNSICFIFPSKYEGFGIPPIEALSIGTPVVSSDAASLPEVLMDRALYFQSESSIELEYILLNIRSLVKTMPRGLNDYQKQNYSYIKSAEKIIELIGK